MTFQITILGSNSAVPAHGRNPSAQVVEISKKPYLIDCGEGTQMRFSQYGIKSSRIEQIFISHLHGDHYFGLIGLISSYHLLRRNKPLDIFFAGRAGRDHSCATGGGTNGSLLSVAFPYCRY